MPRKYAMTKNKIRKKCSECGEPAKGLGPSSDSNYIMKKCSNCSAMKELTEFYKRQAKCKICHKKSNKLWAEKNKEILLKNTRAWRQNNIERHREYQRISYHKNKIN